MDIGFWAEERWVGRLFRPAVEVGGVERIPHAYIIS
jgi:hypothetical protein